MTVRQYLMRRGNVTVTGTIAFLVVAGASVSSGPSGFVIRFVFAVLIGVVAIAAFISLFEIPCPRCKKSLGRIGFWVANGQMTRSAPLCPHCKISIDREI